MHPGVHAHFARQHGLVTREQLLDLGISPNLIQALLRDGELEFVRRGVYADPVVWAGLDEYRGRPRLRARAAVMRMRRGWVLSHDSAAHELGMEIVQPEKPLVHVTRPGLTNAWTKAGVKHHLARFRAAQVVEVNGIRVLDPARTAVDIARERGLSHGLAACDSAMRMGCPREKLWEAVAPMAYWRGVTNARASVELADPGAQTVIESLGRELVIELGVGDPETQFPVETGRGTFWCDIRVGNHIFECDGKLKYLPRHLGGVADQGAAAVLLDEKDRQTLVCAEGLGLSRIVWQDLWGERRIAARARLRAEYDVTAARFGATLAPHLARNAERLRQLRGA